MKTKLAVGVTALTAILALAIALLSLSLDSGSESDTADADAADTDTAAEEPVQAEPVATGSGLLEIVEIRPAGKRLMMWRDFVNGHRVCEGDRFVRPGA